MISSSSEEKNSCSHILGCTRRSATLHGSFFLHGSDSAQVHIVFSHSGAFCWQVGSDSAAERVCLFMDGVTRL